MSKLEKIEYKNEVLALIVRSDISIEKSEFFSPKEYPFQLGAHVRKKGSEFEPHVHKPVERRINTTQEFLYIQKGKVRATFYDEHQNPIAKTILNEGDAILLVSGGHGFKMLEDSKIIEIKQGPYVNVEKDKIKFK